MDLSVALARGDRGGCEASAGAIERLEFEIGLPFASYYAALWRWLEAQLDGPFCAARARSLELPPLAEKANMSSAWNHVTVGLQRWVLAILGGGAEQMLSMAAQLQGRLPGLDIVIARLHAQCGHEAPVRSALAETAQLADCPRTESWLFVAATSADLCGFVDDRATAGRLHSLLVPYADRVFGLADHLICLGSIARPLGSLAARLGRWDEAEEHFARADAHARSLRAPVLRTLVEVDRVLAFRSHPDAHERRRNRELHDVAVARAAELGLAGLSGRLESAGPAPRQSAHPRTHLGRDAGRV